MSTTVDNRVVNLVFNNDQFEKNVSTSLDTLDKLKDSLKFKDTSQGLENLNKSIKNVDTSTLVSSVERVSNGFSAMEVAAITAIANITNRLTNAAVDWVKSISVDQIMDGFSKYEQELKSVQTMMATTKSTMAEATEQMRNLSWYTEETSYSYSGMVENISKFTAQGIDLKDAVSSMQGIANMAGYAGASVTDATHSMEGFAKAMAAGFMSKQNWHWIQTAHMETVQTKQAFIDAAVAEKRLQKVNETTWKDLKGNTVTIANFNETLKDQWLDSKVMQAAFKNMSSYSDILHAFQTAMKGTETGLLSCSDAMDMLGDTEDLNTDKVNSYIAAVYEVTGKTLEYAEAVEELTNWQESESEKAFKLAQQYRTFGDAVEATKEAVSSSWREIFSYIFGNAEQATKLWSFVGGTMYEVFVTDLYDIKEAIRDWSDQGGFNLIYRDVEDGFSIVTGVVDKASRVFGTFKEVFDELFPKPTAEQLLEITAQFAKFIEVTTLSDEAVANLKIVLTRLLGPLGNVKKVLVTVVEFIAKAAIALEVVVEYLLEILANAPPLAEILDDIWKILSKFVDGNAITNFLSTALKLGKGLASVIISVGSSLAGIVTTLVRTGKFPISVAEAFEKIFGNERFVRISAALEGKSIGILKAFTAFKPIINFVSNVLNNIASKAKALLEVGDAFESIGTSINNFNNSVLDKITNLIVALSSINLKGILFDATGQLKELGSSLSSIFPTISDGVNEFKAMAEGIKYAFTDVTGNMQMTAYAADDFVVGTYQYADGMTKVAGSAAEASEATKEMAEDTKTTGEVLKDYFSNGGVTKSVDDFGTKLLRAKEFLGGFFEKMTAGKAIALAFAGTTVYSSLKITSSFTKLLKAWTGFGDQSTSSLKSISDAISELLSSLGGGIRQTFNSVTGFIDSFKQRSTASIITSVAIAIGVLATSLIALAHVPYEDLKHAGEVLVTLMGAMGILTIVVGFIEKLNKTKGVDPKLAVGLLAFATAMLEVVAALRMMDGVDFLSAQGKIVILEELCGVLVGATILISKYAPKLSIAALSLVAFALAAKGIVKNFLAIQGIESFGEVVTTFTDTIKSIGEKIKSTNFGAAFLKFSDNLGALIAGLVGVAAAYGIFKLGKSVTTNILAIGLTLFGMAAAMAVMVRVLERLDKYEFKHFDQSIVALIGIAEAVAMLELASAAAGKNSLKFATGMLLLTASMWSIVGMFKVLEYFEDRDLKRGLMVIGGITLMIDAMMVASQWAGGITSFLGIVTLLGTVMAGLVVLTIVDMDELVASGISLGIVLAAIATALKLSTKCKIEDAVKFLAVTGVMAAIAYTLWKFATTLQGVDIVTPTATLLATVVVLAGIFALLGKFTNVGIVVEGALALSAGLAIVLFSILGTIALLGDLAKYCTDFDEVFTKGGEVLVKIGDFIGKFIGAVAGGINVAFSSTLSDTVDNLIAFKDKISPFLEWCSGLSDDVEAGVSRFTHIMLSLSGAQFVSAWSSIGSLGTMGGEAAVNTFGEFFKIKEKAAPFFEWMKKINVLTVTGANNFASILVTLSGSNMVSSWSSILSGGWLGGLNVSSTIGALSTIEESAGGFFDWIKSFTERDVAAAQSFANVILAMSSLGQNQAHLKDLADSSEPLQRFAENLLNFGEKITGVTAKEVVANNYVCQILERITKASSTIENEGGLLGKIAGNNNLAQFSNQLITFGESIRVFTTKVKGVSDTAVEDTDLVCKVLERITKASKTISNEGGLAGEIFGNNNLDVFSREIISFGESMRVFGTKIKDLDDSYAAKADTAARMLVSLAEAASMIPETEGLFQKIFTGSVGYKEFNGFLKEVATSIKDFVDDVTSQVTPTDIATAKQQVMDLKDMILDLNSVTEVGPIAFGNALDDIALAGINRFVRQFENSEDLGLEAVNNFLNYALGKIEDPIMIETFASDGKALIAALADGINQNCQLIVNAGKNAVDGIILGLSSKNTEVKNVGIKLAERFRAGFEEELKIKSPSRVMMQDAGYVIGGLVEGIGNNLSKVKTLGIDVGKAYHETFCDYMGIHSNADVTIEDGKFTIGGFIEGIGIKLPELKNICEHVGESMPEWFRKGFNSKWETVKDAFQSYLGDGTLTDGDILAQIKAALAGENKDGDGNDDGDGGIEGASKKATKSCKELAEAYKFGEEAIYQFSDMYGRTIMKIDESVNPVDIATYAISNLAQTLYKESTGAVDIAYASQEELTKILDEIKTQFQETADNINGVISGIDIFSNFDYEEKQVDIENILNNATQWNKVAEDYKDRMKLVFADTKIGDELKKYVSTLGYEDALAWADMLLSADAYELDQLEAYYKNINELSKTAGDEVNAAWAGSLIDINNITSEGLQKIVADVNNTLATGFNPEAGTIGVQALCENILGTMQSTLDLRYVYGIVDDVCKGLGNRFVNLVPAVTPDVENFTYNTIHTMIEVLHKNSTASAPLYMQADGVGQNMLDGLRTGIDNQDKRDEVVASITSLCQRLIDAAKEKIDSNSPSKVFAEIGGYIDEGLVVGIRGETDEVVAATKDMAGATIDTFSTVVKQIADFVDGNFDYNPTITPTLDLSNVEAGASTLGSLLNANKYAASIAVSGIQNGASSNGAQYQFVQNNYSPKSLSRIDIYRQTKNQFAMMKEVTNAR